MFSFFNKVGDKFTRNTLYMAHSVSDIFAFGGEIIKTPAYIRRENVYGEMKSVLIINILFLEVLLFIYQSRKKFHGIIGFQIRGPIR